MKTLKNDDFGGNLVCVTDFGVLWNPDVYEFINIVEKLLMPHKTLPPSYFAFRIQGCGIVPIPFHFVQISKPKIGHNSSTIGLMASKCISNTCRTMFCTTLVYKLMP